MNEHRREIAFSAFLIPLIRYERGRLLPAMTGQPIRGHGAQTMLLPFAMHSFSQLGPITRTDPSESLECNELSQKQRPNSFPAIVPRRN